MDISTLLGLLLSLGLVGGAIAIGGNFSGFVDVPSLIIVIGGTFMVTATSFPLLDILRGLAAAGQAFTAKLPDPGAEAERIVKLCQKARQGGLLSLQKEAQTEPRVFFQQGITLAIDGAPPELIDKILVSDTATHLARQQVGLQVLKRAAEVAPAMGLIGTLIGLIQMLGNLSEPDKIGPSMAIAILTTFYGSILAYMVFSPLASKLERAGAAELLLRKLYTTGTLAMAKQENPRQIELQLNAILPPAHRIALFR
ncbi:MAG: flagellar motor protein MotA [Alphaproteobacteria bacterium CG_4_10_14_0_8_um_filter_53_9]|nr:MAG: flagellar motor protein MotA [Alphaproteobacteria bacterium CG_4_10_14_0_8_um_filter_53_9]